MLPDGLHARIDADAWAQPRLMAFLQAQGAIEPEEMARTFNCGIGMAVIVAEADAPTSPPRSKPPARRCSASAAIEAGEKGCTVAGIDRDVERARRLVRHASWLNARPASRS